MLDDLHGRLLVAVAEVAWHLMDDGLHEDSAIEDAMRGVYTIELDALSGWSVAVVGLCPAAILPLAERWQFEVEVWELLRGGYDDAARV